MKLLPKLAILAILAIGYATGILATGYAIVAVLMDAGTPTACHVSQPVYSGTRITGTWRVTLPAGQSVTLPDGDTATCTARGLYIH